jgi:hypothetical protein
VGTTSTNAPSRNYLAHVTYAISPTFIFDGGYALSNGAIISNRTDGADELTGHSRDAAVPSNAGAVAYAQFRHLRRPMSQPWKPGQGMLPVRAFAL